MLNNLQFEVYGATYADLVEAAEKHINGGGSYMAVTSRENPTE